jgi:hypothetical protein
MYVLIFSTTYVWNISHSQKKGARYDQICKLVFMSSTFHSCPILIELEFSWQIFKKNTLISNFMKIRPVGAELYHVDRQMYQQTWRS